MLSAGCIVRLSDNKDPRSLERINVGDQWHLKGTGFPEDGE